MGRASRRKGGKDPRPGFTPELTEKLSRGLSPEELADPQVIRQITEAVRDNPPGTYMFTEGSAPGAAPAGELPELAPGELAQEEPQGGSVPLRPSQVLDLHSGLAARLARRDPVWVTYLGAFMKDALSRGVEGQQDAYETWGVMFQPATSPGQYCGVLARQLQAARTYQVTGGMAGVVGQLYEKTASQVSVFRGEDVPWPAGFAYLDKPLSLRDRHGLEIKNRAVSWNMELSRLEGDKPGTPPRPAVRIVCWSAAHDRDYYWDEVVRDTTLRLGGLSLAHSVIIPFGQEYRSLTERRGQGAPPDDVSRWLHALWLVMETEISALRRAPGIERHVRKRALKSLTHGEVTVVLLRRAVSKTLEEGGPGHRYVDWACRWVVQGFWRHQHKQPGHHAAPDQFREHCVVCAERISWVRPHLRGPSDKPLKQSSQLYKLAR